MELNTVEIGKRIRHGRKELGLSISDMCIKCGIASSGSLSKIENGVCMPSPVTYFSLAQVLGYSMEYLLTGEKKYKTEAKEYILTKTEEQFINGIRQLPQEEQSELYDILELKLRKVKGDAKKMEKSSNLGASQSLCKPPN